MANYILIEVPETDENGEDIDLYQLDKIVFMIKTSLDPVSVRNVLSVAYRKINDSVQGELWYNEWVDSHSDYKGVIEAMGYLGESVGKKLVDTYKSMNESQLVNLEEFLEEYKSSPDLTDIVMKKDDKKEEDGY